MSSERTWNDYKSKTNLKKGQWSAKELNKLRKLICKYAAKHGLTAEQLGELCGDTTPAEFSNVWTQIAKFFPNRSVQAVHNACKRNFNPFNYKGRWTLQEEQQLIEYVEKFGHKWKEIAELLQRTALNVKDKWKQLGGRNHTFRKSGPWTIEEIAELVNLVFENLDIKRISSKKLQGDDFKVLKRIERYIERYKNHFQKEINWEAIAERIKIRSSVDCRLKWSYLLNAKLSCQEGFGFEEDMKLYHEIKEQNPVEEEDINFKRINNGRSLSENKNRWRVLSRAISGRLNLTAQEILEKIEYAYEVASSHEETILDFYLKNYK